MDYHETIDFLYSQLPMFQRQGAAAYKADLKNTLALCSLLRNPELTFPSIHIAGTNGKGSTANMIASTFQQAGYKTGLYTSPHLTDFRERIRINGQMITQSAVVDFVAKYGPEFAKIAPSFFEITFAMAMYYFRQQKVDIAVVETGMGGRLDSTNVIKSILSIITNIGLDHTQYLGDTLEKIAFEKAGIIKKNIPVLIGERQRETTVVFNQKAAEQKATISWAEDSVGVDLESTIYKVYVEEDLWAKIDFPIKSIYQKKNLQTAIAALLLLQKDWKLSKEIIIKGLFNILKNTHFEGRWQQLMSKPRVIVDTGHNVEGLTYTMSQLRTMSCDKLHFVIGMVNDKAIDKILSLLPKYAEYYFCEADIPRALNKDILKEEADKQALKGEVYNSVYEAFEASIRNANANDIVFVGGSTFIVAEVLASKIISQ